MSVFDFSTPDYLDDIPPSVALGYERSRRLGLDWLGLHDYQLVFVPLVDYQSNLTIGDDDLDLQTFKMTDTLSGRTLGLRADQTPQIARFDATSNKNQQGIRRYCYCGPTLRMHPQKPGQSREGMQLGAELFGTKQVAADWEIIDTALGTLAAIGLTDLCVDIGHADLFYQLTTNQQRQHQQHLMQAVTRRDVAVIEQAVKADCITRETAKALVLLTEISGEPQSLTTVSERLPVACKEAATALIDLALQLQTQGHDVNVNLSDLGSYGYHTGITFTLYAGTEVAGYGGRYRHRLTGEPAVGFSLDLRMINALMDISCTETPVVSVPVAIADDTWQQAVMLLRRQQRRFSFVYDNQKLSPPMLIKQDRGWTVCEQ